MTGQDKSFVTKLFASVVAFVFVFIIVAIVGGFVSARLLGLPVDVERFYATINPAFTMILGAVVGFIAGGGKADQGEPKP